MYFAILIICKIGSIKYTFFSLLVLNVFFQQKFANIVISNFLIQKTQNTGCWVGSVQGNMGPIHSKFHSFCNEVHGLYTCTLFTREFSIFIHKKFIKLKFLNYILNFYLLKITPNILK
jgi:hypothetical protein